MRHWVATALAAQVWLGFGASAWAQADGGEAGLRFSGSTRLRLESIAGAPRAGVSAHDDLVNLRTRVLAEGDLAGWSFGAELYDSRAYGADDDTPLGTNEVNALELVQAYASRSFALGETQATAQAGRFVLNLGARRLVAADDFRNTTNGYTGVRLDLARDGASATLIAVAPQVRKPDGPEALRDNAIRWDRESAALQLFGGLASVPALADRAFLQPSYFYLHERDRGAEATRDRRLHTAGLRAFRDPRRGAWDFDVEGFRQWGDISASAAPGAARQQVSAWFVHAEIGRSWDAAWRPRLAFELDVASGDRPGGDYERFDTLFGMRRAEIAPAGLYNAIGRANLESPALRLEVQPSARWDAALVWRRLALESRFDAFSTTGVRDASGAAGDEAGDQINARARFWLVQDRVRLEGTLVALRKGPFFDAAPNAPRSGDTLYTVLDLTYSF